MKKWQKWYLIKCFPSCPSPISTPSSNTFISKKYWWTLIILKNQLNDQLNIVILKPFAYHKIFCKMIFFFTNLSQGNFLHCARFFLLTKNLNTARTPTEMSNWNKTNLVAFFFFLVKIFVSFVIKVIKHQSR